MALVAPASFIFTGTVLQVENWKSLAGILVLIRRGINAAVTVRVAGLGEIKNLAQLAMWDVLERIQIVVLGGEFDSTAPAAGAEKIKAVRVRNLRTINYDLIVMK